MTDPCESTELLQMVDSISTAASFIAFFFAAAWAVRGIAKHYYENE